MSDNLSGSLLKMLLPLFVLWLVAWLAYTYLLPTTKNAGDETLNQGETAVTGLIGDTQIDFGDFNITGLQRQLNAITDGFKKLTADNAVGLAEKITGLATSMDEMSFDQLTGPAKAAVATMLTGFKSSIEGSLNGIAVTVHFLLAPCLNRTVSMDETTWIFYFAATLRRNDFQNREGRGRLCSQANAVLRS